MISLTQLKAIELLSINILVYLLTDELAGTPVTVPCVASDVRSGFRTTEVGVDGGGRGMDAWPAEVICC